MSAHIFVAVILWFVVALAVGIHAFDRGRSGFFWGILTIVTGILGLIAYLVVMGNELDDPNRGEGEENVVVCPNCSARHAEPSNFCSDCGESLEEAEETSTASVVRSGSNAYCGNCNARVEFGADECESCGSVF